MSGEAASSCAGGDPVFGWPLEDIEAYYSQGACHVFAAAMQSLTGLRMAVMWNPFEWHRPPDRRGRGGVLEVVHVYLEEPGGRVIDIKGRRSLDDMKRDMAWHDWQACPCEPLSAQRLSALISDSENLKPFDDADIEEALEVIRRSPTLSALVREYRPDWSADAPAMAGGPGRK